MFSTGKFKSNSIVANTYHQLVKPPNLVPFGSYNRVDPNFEVDVMIASDTSSSMSLSTDFNPTIRNIGLNIQRSWPLARFGRCGFTDYTTSPGANASSVPYEEYSTLQTYTEAGIVGWTWVIKGTNSSTRNSALDALKQGAESTTFGWRAHAPGRQRVILIFTDVLPRDTSVEPGTSNTTKALAVQACINNSVWPIWVNWKGSIYNTTNGYNLGYGISPIYCYYYSWSDSFRYYDFRGYTGYDLVIPEILGAIYNGIIS